MQNETIFRARARDVQQAAQAVLDKREAEFLRSMLDYVDIDTEGLDLIALRLTYQRQEVYDEVWLGEGSDAARHEADDYYQSYVAGAGMALKLMLDAFGITPDQEPS